MTKCVKSDCNHDADGAICVLLNHDNDVVELAFCHEHIGDARIDYLLPNPTQIQLELSGDMYEVCKLWKLVFFYTSQEYFIVLRSLTSRSIFLMQTGYVEACSIYGAINRPPHPIPLTYQLYENLVHALDGSIVEAVFDGYNKEFQVYESQLVIGKQDGTVKIRCRGSDAVGISFLAKAPIKVNVNFLGKEETAM